MSEDRRGFLKKVTVLLGGLVGAALAVPGLRFFAFPAGVRTVQDSQEPVSVADDSAIIQGAKPVRVPIIAHEQRDAWSKRSTVPLGAAWLLRDSGGHVRAFSTTCPHLGCAVDYDDAAGEFRCPCHTSAFKRNGERDAGPAKRGLDPLRVTIKDGRVLVKFERFVIGIAERKKA